MNYDRDEKIRDYFLGKINAPEAESFEEKYAESEDLTEYMQTVEGELTDDFLRGNLSAADALAFEKKYLITQTRRDRLKSTKILWQTANESKQTVRPLAAIASKSRWEKIFADRRIFQLAFGCLILLMVLAGLLFYLPKRTIDRSEVAEIREPSAPVSGGNSPAERSEQNETRPVEKAPLEIQKPKNNEKNTVAEKEESLKIPENPPKISNEKPKIISAPNLTGQKASGFAAFVLSAGNLRGADGEQSVTLAPGVKSINLLLSPSGEPNKYKIYRAILRNSEGGAIYTASDLKSLSFKISAEKLQNRTYIVSLEGRNSQGAFESIEDYVFRVRRSKR